MGYFANGTEQMMYEARYCARCVHEPSEDRGCPVMDLHLLYNYDQHKRESTAAALSMLIPRLDVGNGQCALFWERGRPTGGGEPIETPRMLTIVRAA